LRILPDGVDGRVVDSRRGQGDRGGLQDAPYLDQLQDGPVLHQVDDETQPGQQEVGLKARHVRAVAPADVENLGVDQRPNRLPQGIPRHPDQGCQLRFRR
jgi:hypothetical protein